MSHHSIPYDGVSPLFSRHSFQPIQPERLSFRNSIVPTSRFTLSPRPQTTPRFNLTVVPSHIVELDSNQVHGGGSTLAVLEGRRLRNNDSLSTSGSSIYSTTQDEKALPNKVSPHGELPKIAVRRGLSSNWTLIAPHILAISVTTAVCQLSFRNVFWMDLQSPQTKIIPGLTQGGVMNLLQVVAKVHELMILASISTIVLHAFQASLTGPDGIPLGLMANVFDLSSGTFLRQKSFWASIVSSGDSNGSRFRFTHLWVLTLFATMMVMISGPSSAIAILPTLNFFDLLKPFNQTIRPLYIFNRSSELWPTQLTATSLNGPDSGNNCTEVAGSTGAQSICPAGGFREIYSWSGNAMFGNIDEARNISFQDESSNTRRIVTVQSCNTTFSGRASGMGINAFLHRALTSYWVFAQQNFHGKALTATQPRMNVDSSVTNLYAPRIEILCNSFDSQELSPTFPTFDGSIVSVPGFPSNFSHSLTSTNFAFINISPSSNKSQSMPFLGSLLTYPIISLSPKTNTPIQTIEHVACSIYTSWHPITASYSPTTSDQISYQPLIPFQNSCLNIPTAKRSPSPNQQPINTTITAPYSAAINQKIFFTPSNHTPVFTAIFSRYLSTDSPSLPGKSYFLTPLLTDSPSAPSAPTRRARLIATILAGTITDSLARVAGNGVFPYTSPILLLPNRTDTGELQGRYLYTSQAGGRDLSLNTTEFEDVKNWVRVKITWRRYGYGYLWRSSWFGIAVLGLHGVLAGMYVGWIVWRVGVRGMGVERAWEGVLEFVVLGMGREGRLVNTCAGVETTGVWREMVAVRECEGGEGRLEIVVGEGEVEKSWGRKVRCGVEYGAI